MTRSTWSLALVVAGLGLACTPGAGPSAGAPAAASSASIADDAGLEVGLRVSTPRVAKIADLRATITLTNHGLQPRRLQLGYIGAGNLSLEVQDPSGERVPGMSPPVPRVEDGVTGWVTLAPGGSQSIDTDGGIAIDAPPGRYRVRFVGVPGDPSANRLKSGWVTFDVGK